MTQIVEISEVLEMSTSTNLGNKIRIFSLRGCHLLAMLARTPVAEAFRRWVLDVLERVRTGEFVLRSSSRPQGESWQEAIAFVDKHIADLDSRLSKI